MLHKFLHQERFPLFTVLSILTTLLIWAAVIKIIESAAAPAPESGFPLLRGVGVVLTVIAMVALGVYGIVLNGIWGILAHFRREYCGGRIAAAGIALPLAFLFTWVYVSWALEVRAYERAYEPLRRAQEVAEHSRMWGAISEVFVQPDGKLALIGGGLVRLLPDGRTAAMHRTCTPRETGRRTVGDLPYNPTARSWSGGAANTRTETASSVSFPTVARTPAFGPPSYPWGAGESL
jgi:hypothetical protein